MKSSLILSFFGLILAPAATLSAANSRTDGAEGILKSFDELSSLISETLPLVKDIDFDNAQATAEASQYDHMSLKVTGQTIRDKLNEMLRTCVDLVEDFYEPQGVNVVKTIKEDEQREVCTKFDQFTPKFLDFLLELDTVSIGVDAKTKNITKRVLYIMEQFFVGFDLLRHGPIRKLIPVCKVEAEANTNKILDDLKVLIRAYGGTTDCSRLGGPMVNHRKTCAGSGHSVWEFPGGIQF